MTNRDDLPALGTAEAAVQSCVRLIASVTAQPTELLGYYLDLYYQVRHTYEIEVGAEDEPQRIYREDLEPVLQAVLETALHKIATDEAKRRQAKKTAAAEPVQPPAKKPSAWTAYKRKVSDKLTEARAAGISIASIAAASCGVLGEHRVMDAINAATLSKEEWKALERALDQISAAAAEAAG